MEREIRKHQNTIIVIGTGILLFTLWSVVKTIATLDLYLSYRDLVDGGSVIVIVTAALLVADVLLRVFTALKARSAGHKMNGKISYIFTASILVFLHILAIVYYLTNFNMSFDSVLDTIITCVIEGTGAVMAVELIYSGIRLKKLLSSVEGQVG